MNLFYNLMGVNTTGGIAYAASSVTASIMPANWITPRLCRKT